ncbi:hypothetical protein [Xanthovirga aplysinae]|uniref:hypothetical protein n=1 Tax=Xanthovirga aplysinae TaxID=2529853 RepID=UPI0012BD1BA3|nr:hypothetical protein [Xanthovirga aplysinae]MTI31710.1 hypothetical protein [Xanthovirga aplysinae]
MIRVNGNSPNVMEFTTFKKKENISDDDLIKAVLEFETVFLARQEGVIFHALVRNFHNEYANVIFAKDMESFKCLEKEAHQNAQAQKFFSLIEEGTVEMAFHTINKEDFRIPDHFSCLECGTFKLKEQKNFEKLVQVSDRIENNYLSKFENTQEHFIGTIADNLYSEVTLGKTLGKTKEICSGYVGNPICQPMLDMAEVETMKLDFWYLIA